MIKEFKFFPIVQAVASLSKDRSTKVGAVAIGPNGEIRSTGYNGFAKGVDDAPDERHERPAKYLWTCHAEENAIAQAARFGASLDGCTMLVYGLPPCSNCSRMMIQAGIKRVVVFPTEVPLKDWMSQFKISEQMFVETGIKVEVVDCINAGFSPVLNDNERDYPDFHVASAKDLVECLNYFQGFNPVFVISSSSETTLRKAQKIYNVEAVIDYLENYEELMKFGNNTRGSE